jgi:hypothetical protein
MRPLLEPTPPAINPAETVALYREPIRTPRMEPFVGHVRNPAAINGVRVVNYNAGRVVLPTPVAGAALCTLVRPPPGESSGQPGPPLELTVLLYTKFSPFSN